MSVSDRDAPAASPGRPIDSSKIAYQLPQPIGMVPDVWVGAASCSTATSGNGCHNPGHVSFRPLVLNVSQGYYINILRVRASGVLSRHRHPGPVHAFTLRGRWRYLEHDWVATAGDYAFEPPGETHTLVVPDDVKEMATLFHVTGGYTYVDPTASRARIRRRFHQARARKQALRSRRASERTMSGGSSDDERARQSM